MVQACRIFESIMRDAIVEHFKQFNLIFRSSQGLIDLLKSGESVCPYVRPSVRPQSFSNFDVIWCVARPRPDMCINQYDLDPIHGQGQGASEVPKIAVF